MNTVLSILKNKTFWYIVIGLIIVIVVLKNLPIIKARLKRVFKGKKGDYGNYQFDENGKPVNITEARKNYLIQLANTLYQFLDSYMYASDTNEVLTKINALNDTEFDFLAKYYNSNLGNMYEMIDDKFMPMYSSDELTMSKLKQHSFA